VTREVAKKGRLNPNPRREQMVMGWSWVVVPVAQVVEATWLVPENFNIIRSLIFQRVIKLEKGNKGERGS